MEYLNWLPDNWWLLCCAVAGPMAMAFILLMLSDTDNDDDSAGAPSQGRGAGSEATEPLDGSDAPKA